MRVCPICANENTRKTSHSIIYIPGWINYYNDEQSAEGQSCTKHPHQKLIKSIITCEEFEILRRVSNDPSFIQAMDELKQKDIIEFNLKMSQFKTQVLQTQQKENNTPKCPTCSSTNIEKIGGLERAGSVYMFGIFSKKINKSFKCNNCGMTF